MKKRVAEIMVTLLLTSMLMLAFNIEQARSLEPPETEWSKTYGGTNDDSAYSAVQTSDGGYAIVGPTRSFALDWSDAWLIKTDANGNVQWSKTYNRQYRDAFMCIIRTSDGGYAIAGITRPSFAGPVDAWLVKVDSSGTKQWDKTYGGAYDDYAYALLETGDGGYALAGQTNSLGAGGIDFWLFKTDSNGNMQWSKTYGGTGWEEAMSIVATDDGGYTVAGYTNSFGAGNFDAWLVNTDSEGNVNWNKTYGGSDWDAVRQVLQIEDEGYTLVGYTKSFGAGNFDAWLIKTDMTGNVQWERTFGEISDEHAYSIVTTGCVGYAIAGWTQSFGAGNSDFWLIRTDASGNVQWDKTEGGTGRDEAQVVLQTSDGGYALAGYTNSFGAGGFDVWLIKLVPETITATVDVNPDTLNLNGKGKWVTAYIELPEAYDVNGIDVSSIMLNDTVPVDTDGPTFIGDHDGDGVIDLMVKFDRQAVIELILSNVQSTEKFESAMLTISGELNDGTILRGSDTIKVIFPTSKKRGGYILPE